MQRQIVLTVRVVFSDDITLEDAEEIVCNALEQAELMANVKAESFEDVEE